ncbi:hypothetical protein VKT23_020636 [Stygiomarasmius scandens]|uniref:Uncharacterized protein n=1 Tax=Marasmiellus scandens TaxID=2682957 RepID=A0ABR1IL20_9AGAR
MAKSTNMRSKSTSKLKTCSKTCSKAPSQGRSTTRRREPTPIEEESKEEEESDSEDKGPRHTRKRKAQATITESLQNRRKRKGDGQRLNDLDVFKSAARCLSSTWSPYIDWSCVLNTGLDRDEVIEEGCKNVADKEPEQSQILEVYDTLLKIVPNAEDLLCEVVEN